MEEVTVSISFQGPIPPPAILAGYERVLPGSGQAIMDEFRKEGAHRRDIEQRLASHAMTISRRGQMCALMLGLTGLAGGIYLCGGGNNVGGLGMVGTSLLALVGMFLKSQAGEKEPAGQAPAPPTAEEPAVPKPSKTAKGKKRR